MIADLKQELIEKISATEDENLLILLKEDYDYYNSVDNKVDIIDHLSEGDRQELIVMDKEPFGKDCINQEEFDEAIKRWRSK